MSKSYKIIDWHAKGNLVRFYYGDLEDDEYWGDDWGDSYYHHNAGPVYQRYIKAYKDICFSFETLVLEPCDTYHDASWSKEDMKNRLIPCIVTKEILKDENDWEYSAEFTSLAASDRPDVQKFYFGDIETEENLTIVNTKEEY